MIKLMLTDSRRVILAVTGARGSSLVFPLLESIKGRDAASTVMCRSANGDENLADLALPGHQISTRAPLRRGLASPLVRGAEVALSRYLGHHLGIRHAGGRDE